MMNERRIKVDKLKTFLKEWYKILVVFLISVLVASFIFRYIKLPLVEGESMIPTYQNDTRVVMLRTHDIKINDIVVVWCDEIEEYIVKRVIGLAGDIIDIRHDGLYRNNIKIYESYIHEQDWTSDVIDMKFTIQEGEVFVLGDNRNRSDDSRVFGAFNMDDVFGRVIYDDFIF